MVNRESCSLGAFVAALSLSLGAAERKFDFSTVLENQSPPGFRSAVTGQGKPGTWRVILDDIPSGLPALTEQARGVTKRSVLAQLAQEETDEHFPVLIYDGDTYADFDLKTRFKIVRGKVERMAGIAFRMQNETNYYVVRASSLGNTFRFYKVVNGQREPLVGPEIEITSGAWHELGISCKANEIRCLLDGKELISVTDKINPFRNGKFAFWTKSDSVAYFADTKISYTPREPAAQSIVRETLRKYPKLIDLKIYVADAASAPKLLASRNDSEIGSAGGEAEKAVLSD